VTSIFPILYSLFLRIIFFSYSRVGRIFPTDGATYTHVFNAVVNAAVAIHQAFFTLGVALSFTTFAVFLIAAGEPKVKRLSNSHVVIFAFLQADNSELSFKFFGVEDVVAFFMIISGKKIKHLKLNFN
jgi:hypothetical protein